MAEDRLFRTGDMDIPIPNKAMAQFMVSERLRSAIMVIAVEVYNIYRQNLPASEPDPNWKGGSPGPGEQTLRRGAFVRTRKVDSGGGLRWHAWVGNKALSYRPQRLQPYPRFIEYGKPSRGIAGGGQLRAAAAAVAGRADVSRSAGLVARGLANPAYGQARPAARRRDDPTLRRGRERDQRGALDMDRIREQDERQARERPVD